MFTNFFSRSGILQSLIGAAQHNDRLSVFGCGKGEKLALISCVDKFILYVANNQQQASQMHQLLTSMHYRTGLINKTPTIELNAIDNVFLENINTLRNCHLGNLDALVVVPEALAYGYPNPQNVLQNRLELSRGNSYDLSQLIEELVRFGYQRVTSVIGAGQFSVRGDIVDIYPQNHTTAYRIYFDFDDIESIKQVDAATFLSTLDVEELVVYSNNLLGIEMQQVLQQLDAVKATNTITNQILVSAKEIVESNGYKNNYWFLPFSDVERSSIFSYLPSHTGVWFSDVKIVYDEMAAAVEEYNKNLNQRIKDGTLLKAHQSLKLNMQNATTFNSQHSLIAFQSLSNANRLFSPNKVFNLKTLPATNYNKNTPLLISDLKYYNTGGFTSILFANSAEGVNRLAFSLDGNIGYNICQNIVQAAKQSVNVLPKYFPLSFSFIEEKLFVVGANSLFAKPKQSSGKSIKSADIFLPSEGDFVVHNHHGVGKCLGVRTLSLGPAERDYVIIEYKNNDKLYLPVENIDSISKFVGSDKAPPLSKLGGSDFIKVKNKVKSSIKEMAFDLANLYAQRESTKGYKYSADDTLMLAFEESFAYDETPDQITAIADIKKDMEAGKVMDRLICGDVGFGKTEVALRSAFKTITNGKTVAFLCPTTILSEQHFNTTSARMKQFGVTVEVLNRFKTPAEVKSIMQQLQDGEIDLIVGTHKLLNKNIKFKNLGLLILDEEQKFGVEAKEKIKNLKKNINVLTLTATPIPRTLHMSLTGIRDISVIETPPQARIPTIVSVTEYTDYLLQTAVAKELARAGQVLIIYNKVESIYSFSQKVKSLLGEDVVVDVAHGQMQERQLEQAIRKLYNGQTQVLIATTLIENGVDLPSANTLIVVNADLLGLSQLYQLKGRIGRSDRQAYAYFTYNGGKLLTENAYKRLQAITEFSSMGSGYKIALRDLEIRGAGNVLGKQQHGHLQRVGYAMYVKLLSQVVAELQGKPVERAVDVRIETTINAYISTEYIADYSERIAAYMEISKISSVTALEKQLTNMQNVYGDVPQEVSSLCKISFIKNLAGKQYIERVVIKNNECYLQFENAQRLINDRISKICSAFSDMVVLKIDNLPIIEVTIKAPALAKLDFLIAFLQEFD